MSSVGFSAQREATIIAYVTLCNRGTLVSQNFQRFRKGVGFISVDMLIRKCKWQVAE